MKTCGITAIFSGVFSRWTGILPGHTISNIQKPTPACCSFSLMNAPKNDINCDPEVLADLLTIGMIDRFVAEFKLAASQADTPKVPELITQINKYLDAQLVSQKRMKSRLEYSDSGDVSPSRVDVVTPCKFVGAGWPSRRTIFI